MYSALAHSTSAFLLWSKRKMLQKLIAGNWKMNGSLAANQALLDAVRSGLATQAPACQVAVAVPAPYLAQVQQLLAGSAIALGAQDVSQHASGAFTGEALGSDAAGFRRALRFGWPLRAASIPR